MRVATTVARWSERGEEGVGLLDAVVAVLIVMVVLIPVASLLVTTGKATAGSQFRATAYGLAQGLLDQERLASSNSPTAPPPGLAGVVSGATTFPTTALVATTTQGSETFREYAVGGWCQLLATNGAAPYVWGNYDSHTTSNDTANAASYFVAVKVVWGPGAGPAQTANALVMNAAMPVQPRWRIPSASSSPSLATVETSTSYNQGCPVGLR